LTPLSRRKKKETERIIMTEKQYYAISEKTPTLSGHLSYWISSLLTFSIALYAMFNSLDLISIIHRFLTTDNESLYFYGSNHIFFALCIFIAVLICGGVVIFKFVQQLNWKFRFGIDWYDIKQSKTTCYSEYKTKNRIISIILCVIMLITVLIGTSSIFACFRITDNGITYYRFLSLQEKKYNWDTLNNVEIKPYIHVGSKSNKKSFEIQMNIVFDKYKYDIWEYNYTNPEVVINALNRIHQKTQLYPKYANLIDDQMMQVLIIENNSTKMKAILQVLQYVKELERKT
jgi:hypothetical protein